jgi:hypothetical protein
MGMVSAIQCDGCKRLLQDDDGVAITDVSGMSLERDAAIAGWTIGVGGVNGITRDKWYCRECQRIMSLVSLVPPAVPAVSPVEPSEVEPPAAPAD